MDGRAGGWDESGLKRGGSVRGNRSERRAPGKPDTLPSPPPQPHTHTKPHNTDAHTHACTHARTQAHARAPVVQPDGVVADGGARRAGVAHRQLVLLHPPGGQGVLHAGLHLAQHIPAPACVCVWVGWVGWGGSRASRVSGHVRRGAHHVHTHARRSRLAALTFPRARPAPRSTPRQNQSIGWCLGWRGQGGCRRSPAPLRAGGMGCGVVCGV